MPACLPACPPVCQPSCLPACLPARPPASQPVCLPARPPACPPACLPARLPACQRASPLSFPARAEDTDRLPRALSPAADVPCMAPPCLPPDAPCRAVPPPASVPPCCALPPAGHEGHACPAHDQGRAAHPHEGKWLPLLPACLPACPPARRLFSLPCECGMPSCAASARDPSEGAIAALQPFLTACPPCLVGIPRLRLPRQAFVCVGDSNGHIGLGVKVAKEVATAIRGGWVGGRAGGWVAGWVPYLHSLRLHNQNFRKHLKESSL